MNGTVTSCECEEAGYLGKNRFATVDTVRLELSDGDWIEVKRELTYGDILELQELSNTPDEGDIVRFNGREFSLNRILTWVVAWSFEDENGPVELTRDAVRALNAEAAGEINGALNEHQESRKN